MLAKNITGTVFRGRNVGIIGPNGSGKSTLLKTLLARQTPLAGKIQVGQKVELAYYDQQLSTFDPESTVLEEMRAVSPLATDETLRGYLARLSPHGVIVMHISNRHMELAKVVAAVGASEGLVTFGKADDKAKDKGKEKDKKKKDDF